MLAQGVAIPTYLCLFLGFYLSKLGDLVLHATAIIIRDSDPDNKINL